MATGGSRLDDKYADLGHINTATNSASSTLSPKTAIASAEEQKRIPYWQGLVTGLAFAPSVNTSTVQN